MQRTIRVALGIALGGVGLAALSLLAAAASCDAQDCVPQISNDPVAGSYQRMTPLLSEGHCRPPPNELDLTTSVIDTDRSRLIDDRRAVPQSRLPGQSSPSLLGSVLGDGGGLRSMLSGLSDGLLTTQLGWQLTSDVSLAYRAGLNDASMAMLLGMDAAAHGLAQVIALLFREDENGPSARMAAVFTSAGLMCAHRQSLGIGLGECGGAIALAVASAGLGILTGEHDVGSALLGAAVGAVAGYLLPQIVLYGFGSRSLRRATDHRDDGISVTLSPSFSTSRGLGLRVQGTF